MSKKPGPPWQNITAYVVCVTTFYINTYLLYKTMSGTQIISDGTLIDVTLSNSDGFQHSL